MHDVQLEERLRKALRAEADDLPFTISAELVASRLAARRSAARRARFGLLATAAAIVVVAGAAFAWVNRAVPPVAASQTPVPGQTEGASIAPQPAQSARPTGDVRYPESQSEGELVIAIDGRREGETHVFLTCEWISTERVGYFYLYDMIDLLGEPVHIDLVPDSQYDNVIYIGRAEHASYHGGPTNGGAAVTEVGAAYSSGIVTFTNLTPDPESAPAGPLPTPADGWTLPLGGDQANASISGTATWTCDAPPATVGTPAPLESEEPHATHEPFPEILVHGGGDVAQVGVPGCGGGWQIDGVGGDDSCGPSYQALGPEKILTLKAGSKLMFTVTDGWSFQNWSIGWATQAEAERFRGEQPDTFEIKDRDDAASGATITVDAPPVGDWSVLLYRTVTRGEDFVGFPDYYRIVVVP